MIHYAIRRKIHEIKSKVKRLITKEREFKDDDAVINEAVRVFYEQLKKGKHLKWCFLKKYFLSNLYPLQSELVI